jgi:hypothetical protein
MRTAGELELAMGFPNAISVSIQSTGNGVREANGKRG